MPTGEVAAAFERSRVLVDARAVRFAIDQTAVRIGAVLHDLNPIVMCVLRGGAYYHAELVKRMQFPLEIDFLQVGRYGATTTGGELRWRVEPGATLTGRHVLVVDDVLDHGETLAAVLARVAEAGPASLRSTVLVAKALETDRPKPDWVALDCPDEYLFGCGMDYLGYWRNLPEIRALPADLETDA